MSKKKSGQITVSFTAETSKLKKALHRQELISGGVADTSVSSMMVTISADAEGISLLRRTPNRQLALELDAEVFTEGVLTTNIHSFRKMIENMPGDEISIEATEKEARITCGNAKAKISLFEGLVSPEKFADNHVSIVEDVETFREYQALCLGPATLAARDKSKGYMQGTQFVTMRGHQYMLSTDRRIMTACQLTTKESADLQSTIPSEDMAVIIDLISEIESGVVNIEIGTDNIHFKIPGADYYGSIMADKIPKLDPILNDPTGTKHTFDRIELIAALNATQAAQNESKHVTVKFKDDGCTFISQTVSGEEFEMTIPCESTGSNEFTFNFDFPKMFASGLKQEKITFCVYESGLPSTIFITEGKKRCAFSLIRLAEVPKAQTEETKT